MREAYPPLTTSDPCRGLPTEHLIRHALVAPRARRGGLPLLTLGPHRAPCLLPSGPPQPRLVALPSGFFDLHGRCEGRAVRQDTCLDKPPLGHEPLACQRDKPAPAASTPPVAKARLRPLRERTRWLTTPPSPGHLHGPRADMIVPGFGDATLIGGVATRLGRGGKPLRAPTARPCRKARQPKHARTKPQAL
jgi:hypothetical protein